MHSEIPNRFHYCNMSFKYSKRQRNKTCESHSIHYRQMQSLYFTVENRVLCMSVCSPSVSVDGERAAAETHDAVGQQRA